MNKARRKIKYSKVIYGIYSYDTNNLRTYANIFNFSIGCPACGHGRIISPYAIFGTKEEAIEMWKHISHGECEEIVELIVKT